MESLGHFIWIAFTFPLWFFLTIIWTIVKFILIFLVSIFGFIKNGFGFEDLIFYPFRLVGLTLQDSNIVFDKFSEIYYEHPILLGIIIAIMLIFYNSMWSDRKD